MKYTIAALFIVVAAFFGVYEVANAQAPLQWNYDYSTGKATATYPGNVVINGTCSGCTGSSNIIGNSTPTSGFSAGQFLYSDGSKVQAGTFSTGLSFVGGVLTATGGGGGSGTVTSVTCGSGLTGGTFTTAGTCALGTITLTGDITGSGATTIATTLATVNSNVGTFGDSTHVGQFTVDAKGRITAAANIAVAGGAGGTVTSVAATVPSFLSISGSPITGAGTLAISLSGTALPVANGGTGTTTLTAHGVLVGAGTGAVAITGTGSTGQILTSNGASADPTYQGAPVTSVAAATNANNLLITPTTSAVLVATQFQNNAQSGTTYTVGSGSFGTDAGLLLTGNNASAQTFTFPTTATTGFGAGYSTTVATRGIGALTLTSSSTFLPAAPTLAQGQSADITSLGGGNYIVTNVGMPYLAADQWLGNFSASAGWPTSQTIPSCAADGSHALTYPSHTLSCIAISGGGGGSAVAGTILGMNPIWTSTTVLGAGSGTVYIESSATNVACGVTSVTPSSPAASTWYHFYINGSCTLSASTTAPTPFATPSGNAMSKTGDTTNRYVFSAKTDGSSHFFQFTFDPAAGYINYVGNFGSSPFRVLAAGTATTSTNVSASGCAPVTASSAIFEVNNLDAGVAAYFAIGGITVSASNAQSHIGGVNTVSQMNIPLDTSQRFAYILVGGSPASGTYVDCHAFNLVR